MSRAQEQRQKLRENRGGGVNINVPPALERYIMRTARENAGRPDTGSDVKGRVPNFGDNYANQERRLSLQADGQIYGGLPNNYKQTELAAGQAAEDIREGSGFPGQTPTSSTRDVTGNDGFSKGTLTSPGGGMPILDAAGADAFYRHLGLGGFSTLPAPVAEPSTAANPSASDKEAFETVKSGGLQFFQQGDLITPGATKTTKPKQGGSKRLNDALNDTAGINSYMSKFGDAEADKRRAADLAFLNTKGSQLGLRAKEKELGLIQAGGQTYSLNEKGDALVQGANGKPAAVSRDLKSDYMSGKTTSAQFLDAFKSQLKGSTPATPKEDENIFAQNPAPASRSFEQGAETNYLPGTAERAQQFDIAEGIQKMPTEDEASVLNSFLSGREPLTQIPRY